MASIRDALPMRPFRNLPRANDVMRLEGRPVLIDTDGEPKPIRRWEAVFTATEGVISSTTPSGRYLIQRAGFLTFQDRAKTPFKELSPYDFDSNELRCMFEAILAYRRARGEDRHDDRFERKYQATRSMSGSDEVDPYAYTGDGGIAVETATRGRVQ